MDELQKQAIHAAIDNDWERAILLNKKILRANKHDIDCYLRMAHAYFSKGEIKDATSCAAKALKIDSDHKLAQKFLQKCKLSKGVKPRNVVVKTNLKAFSNNYGKTKLVKLTHIGEPSFLASLIPGESLNLVLSSKKASVETAEKKYVGHFPDDISTNIWSNRDKKYETVFKSFDSGSVVVVLREAN